MPEIRERIEAAARRHVGAPALFDSGRSLTWRQLGSIAGHAADQLRESGDYTLGSVAISGHNSYDLVVALLTVFELNTVVVLLNPRYPAARLQEQLVSQDCRLYLRCDPAPPLVADNLRSMAFQGPVDQVTPSESSASSIFRNRLSTVTFTSGSSGQSRPILHLLRHHYYSATGANANLSVQPGDRWLLSLPLYHISGLGILFRCLFGGGEVVVPDRTTDMAEQVIRDRVTHLSLVPTQLRRMLACDRMREAAKHLKVVLLGGGPVSQTLVNDARRQGFPVYPTYGSTEMASQIATSGPGHEDCMKALSYRELKISNEGEILTRGQTLGWGQKSGASWNLLNSDSGWFHTGDLGRLDDNGCLTVTGRSDNMFVSGGENIHPEQIEAALVKLDGVIEALVVPLEDDEFGHRPVAFMKTLNGTSGLDHDRLRSELEPMLPGFMLPLAFLAWPEDYTDPGLKPDRAFFAKLAVELHSVRKPG